MTNTQPRENTYIQDLKKKKYKNYKNNIFEGS